ncbi:MAG TPA: hypothetical protein PLX23_05125 [Candidatus Hydrogenedens sp.]|nr:hypothetical protein [Candidatus Hydrogenedens sp.]
MLTTTVPFLDTIIFYACFFLFGSLWTIMRAYELYQKVKNSQYRIILTIIESAVQKTYDTYTREIKRSREDGKLTAEERQKAFQLAMQTVIEMAQSQNIELNKIIHKELLPYLIHHSLQKLKLQKVSTSKSLSQNSFNSQLIQEK